MTVLLTTQFDSEDFEDFGARVRSPNGTLLAQVTEMRLIFGNFWARIARKFNADGTNRGETCCSEDLLS